MKHSSTNEQLCLKLLSSDTEKSVIRILTDAGYWQLEDAWENYGLVENNFSTIGNQQSTPERAMVEKLTNSIDAVLTAACFEKGLVPTGPLAPQSIAGALSQFFKIPQ